MAPPRHSLKTCDVASVLATKLGDQDELCTNLEVQLRYSYLFRGVAHITAY